jgi:hypothetical protein
MSAPHAARKMHTESYELLATTSMCVRTVGIGLIQVPVTTATNPSFGADRKLSARSATDTANRTTRPSCIDTVKTRARRYALLHDHFGDPPVVHVQ